ncbi:hypothetical protein [Kitasatospora cineracea]|uniref:Uncharacterized protein n=1 Tax=Kitasatospora cineracea TaxID=88074 RepID=A0A8G1X8S1_9ACTN|nr:hypothetical protein [Kitasatospora cineracea]ROR35817.1 hypothetical protein EDD39_7481 [Kitasatospora cineracea]
MDVWEMAQWSAWVGLEEARSVVPRLPGVYMARSGLEGCVVYVGCAKERAGNGSRPANGMRGRIAKYTSGLASGLGEAALDRALADPQWLRERLAEVEAGQPVRAAQWAKAALARAELELCWAVTATGDGAKALEDRVIAVLRPTLWNR